MTKKEFDNYKFGVKTRVLFDGKWHALSEVDFEERWVGLKNCKWAPDYSQIKDIKEKTA